MSGEESRKTPVPVHRPGIILRLIVYYVGVLAQFLRSTALNGMKYLAFSYLTIWEKLFFLACVVAASYNSLNFAINIVEKWQTSPVLIVMNPEATQITNEPFPAVTICNMNQASKNKVQDYRVHSTEYAMLQKMCFQNKNYTAYALSEFHNANDSFPNFIARSAQSCSDMIQTCQWGSEQMSCTDLFREVLLDEGLCCAFNIAHPYLVYKGEFLMIRDFTAIASQWIPVDWSPEKGYGKDLPSQFYPRVSLGPGVSNGLTLILNGNLDDYYCSSTNGPGFKLQLHNVIEPPLIKETGLYVAFGAQTNFAINVIKDEALATLRSISPKNRLCYFSDELPLKYFRYYTRRNCEAECDASYFLSMCMCIPYYLPLITENVTICYVQHFDCVAKAENNFNDPEKLACKSQCLSACHDITYMPDITSTPIDPDEFNLLDSNSVRNFTRDYVGDNLALVNIFFPVNYYRSNVKTPYTGLTEYLSQTGGIMSLMLGFSVITIIEFIYFFMLKPLMSLWLRCFPKNIISIQESLNNND